MSVKISVIIPVYNAEKYLAETLDSILNQTFKNFEVIAINDGSTDNSLNILNKYGNKDNRIRIINKKNTGVSDTRNIGIQNAVGEYVCFIDSDDTVNDFYLEKMYKTAQKYDSDMVVCSYKLIDSKSRKKNISVNSQYYREDYNICTSNQFKLLLEVGLGIQVWNKLIKKLIISSGDILFEKGITFDEDMFFCWKVGLNCKKIYFCCEPLYYYRLTAGSAIMKYHANLYDSYNRQINDLIDYTKEHNLYYSTLESEINYVLSKKANILISMVIRSRKSYKEKKAELKQIFSNDRMQDGLRQRIENGEKGLKRYEKLQINNMLSYGILSEIKTKVARLVR